ncbi:chaplin [Streptomyces sp. NPDC057386]|uniref:chaplin n=1 Tax=unclassified Streptomyces TaxID=2593676 RepID=UPI003634C9F5
MRVIPRVLAATAVAGLTVVGTSAAAQAAPATPAAAPAGVLSYECDGGACAVGEAVGSPGVLSGNVIQVPIHIPVNVCGNSVNIVGLLNPTAGNYCVND